MKKGHHLEGKKEGMNKHWMGALTAEFDLILECGTESTFRTADGFFNLPSDSGNRSDGGSFKLGHFERR